MLEIDLDKPGKLVASAQNGKDYSFYLVLPKPHYTPAAFQQNPNCVASPDLVLKLGTLPDSGGKAVFDLAAKAKEIKDKVKDPVTEARAIVVATSKPGNQDPQKRLAVVEPCKIKKPLSITVKGLVTVRSPQDWVCYHHPIWFAEVQVRGPIPEVMVDISPKTQPIAMFSCWQQATPGKIDIKKMVLGAPGEPHPPHVHCSLPAAHHRGGWWGGVPGWDRGQIKVPITPGVENYVFAVYPRQSGNVVMSVKGTGEYASLGGAVTFVQTGAHAHPGD